MSALNVSLATPPVSNVRPVLALVEPDQGAGSEERKSIEALVLSAERAIERHAYQEAVAVLGGGLRTSAFRISLCARYSPSPGLAT